MGIRETATDGDIFEAARSRDEELLRPGKPHALKPFSEAASSSRPDMTREGAAEAVVSSVAA